jgi:hypothetical protein
MGTEQLVVETLQLTDSVSKVPTLLLIATEYPVIGEPLSAGATQVIVTLMFELIEVVGAAGTLGVTSVKVISYVRTTVG